MERQKLLQKQTGFTIVELLVVIVVLGILISLSYFGFSAWRVTTATNVLKNDLIQAASQLKNDLNWKNTYPATQNDANGGAGLPKSKGTTYQYTFTASTKTYCLTAVSDTPGVPAYHISSSDTSPQKGPCDGDEGPVDPAAGSTWATNSSSGLWITYAQGKFILTSGSLGGTSYGNHYIGGNNYVKTSTDGVTWNTQTVPQGSWGKVAYGAGKYVAVEDNGGQQYCTMTSTDAVSWTPGIAGNSTGCGNDMTIAYGNGLFVMTGTNYSGGIVLTSPDGITWTPRYGVPYGDWQDVVYANGMYVAVGTRVQYGRVASIMTSPDGITWTARSSPTNCDWRSITYGSGTFVAVGENGGTNSIMTSNDGINWQPQASPARSGWSSVTYGSGKFIAVGDDGSVSGNKNMMTSTDGKTWSIVSTSFGRRLSSIVYGKNIFVATGPSGSVVSQ